MVASNGSSAGGPASVQGDPAGARPRRIRPWVLALIGVALIVVIGVVVWATVSSAVTAGVPSSTPTSAGAATPTPSSAVPDATAPATPSADSGDGDDTRATAEPVPFDTPAEIAPGVSASVGSITAVTGVASGVGESGGPAIRFEVTITNAGAEAIDLQNARVTVDSGADLVPASELSGGPDIVPFPASLEPGASATAAYVFTVPVEARSDVRITLDYLASVPFALFVGAAPAS
jgi:hypothetical protein